MEAVFVKRPVGRPRKDRTALALAGGTADRLHRQRERKHEPLAVIDRGSKAIVAKLVKRYCRTMIPGYDPWKDAGKASFHIDRAVEAIEWFHFKLTHVKGALARKAFNLEPWQQAIVGNLFGWLRPDGTRRYRAAFILVGRKNGKTPLAAGLVLYLLFKDGEYGAEIYGAANEYKQATLVFEHARGMVLHEPELRERAHIYAGQAKAIQLSGDEGHSTYRPIGGKTDPAHGFNSHGIVIDELHTQPDRSLYDALWTSTGARRQPLMVCITTADYEREGSICNEVHDHAKAVRDGHISDPSFLPVVYEVGKDEDWHSEAVWRKANPNMGISISMDYLRQAHQMAVELPHFENTFKRLHLNIRTEQETRLIPMDAWDACKVEFKRAAYKNRQCWAGLDLAGTNDTNAFVLLFDEPDGIYSLLPFFWVPKERATERERRDRIPYSVWVRDGLIRMTEGKETDYAKVRKDIVELAKEFRIRDIALDRWFQGAQLGQELQQQDGLPVTAFGQGFLSMAAPTKRFCELVSEGKMHHDGNPVLRWMAGNVAAEIDAAGNMKPSKAASTEKIDGIVAAIMALGRAMVQPTKVSIYTKRWKEKHAVARDGTLSAAS